MKNFPDFDFASGGAATAQFLSLGIADFRAAVEYVWRLPYGRNSNRADYNLVLKEQRGTCSTKHALLAQAAFEQDKSVCLTLGIYEMNGRNTPGIGAVLDEFRLECLPEAHCYLMFSEKRIDITRFSDAQRSESIENFLFEESIRPDQIGDYKIVRHQTFFRQWICERKLNEKFNFEELWRIRERCIAALAENL